MRALRILAAIAVGLLLTGCMSASETAASRSSSNALVSSVLAEATAAFTPPEPDPVVVSDHHLVEYRVDGTATKALQVSYSTQNFGISQDADAALPWAVELPMSGAYSVASMNAQNAGGGSITCTIKVDNVVVDTNTSNGQFAIVSCSTSLGG